MNQTTDGITKKARATRGRLDGTKLPHYVIGIDPDCERSGFASWLSRGGTLTCRTLTFAQLIVELYERKKYCDRHRETAVVVVEAGWTTTANWHIFAREGARLAAAKGYDVGRNHEVGRKIVEWCKHLGFEVVEQPPLVKGWRGKDGKITHDELAYFAPVPRRTNQEMRDAVLLCWHYAQLPIRLKPRIS